MGRIISFLNKMKYRRKQILISSVLIVVSIVIVNGQVPSWRVGLFTFFDNIEFGGSELKIPQTMSGVRISPVGGLTWDSVHTIHAGIDLLHEFGSKTAIDNFYPLIYYELNRQPFRFIMGAFPKPDELRDYPRLFFQDSVGYYRPDMNGVFWEYRRKKGYVDIWLDWTGRQSETVRETFLAGLSGRYNHGILYARYYGYMFHFAGAKNPVVSEAYHDNMLSLASVGIDLSGRTFLTGLEANAGWVGAAERSRADNTGWILMSGFLAEARAEYKFIGIFNTFYTGSRLMYFYNTHNIDLYWGDPVFRAGTYNRSDLYLRFYNSNTVSVDVTYSLHFLEHTVYHEQLLKVRVNLRSR